MDKRVGVRKRFDIYPVHRWSLNGNDTLSGGGNSKVFASLLKRVLLYKKRLSSLLEQILSFRIGPIFRRSFTSRKSRKLCPYKNERKTTKCIKSP